MEKEPAYRDAYLAGKCGVISSGDDTELHLRG